MNMLSRREFLAIGLAASAGLARGAGPGDEADLHRQILDLARRQQAERRARFAAVADPAGLETLRGELRRSLLGMLGGLPEASGPPPTRSFGHLEGDGYRIERLAYESLPGFHVSALLYRPADLDRPAPGILSPCGHSAVGKAAEPYQMLHINLARRGFVVLTFDPVGQGERSQFWDPARGRSRFNLVCGEHAVLGNPLYLLGMNLARFRVHDGRRGLDLLASLPEVDPDRLGCVGNSGGGNLTAYIAALDDRVRAAVISCYTTALPRRMANRIEADPDADPEQDLFGFVAEGVDHPGLLALCAPRPTLLCTARRDFFPIEGARETFDEARRLYEIAGAGDRLARVEEDQKHGLTRPLREAACGWFDRWLLGRGTGAAVAEHAVTPRPAAELTVSPDGQVNRSLDSRPLLAVALDAFRAEGRNPDRDRWLARVGRADPDASARVEHLADGDRPDRTLVLCLNGNEAPDWRTETAFTAALIRRGHAVAVVDPRGVGRRRPDLAVPDHSYDDPLCGVEENLAYNAFLVGRSLIEMRAADLRSCLDEVTAGRRPGRIVVCARRDAALVACLAAAVDRRIDRLALEAMILGYRPLFDPDGHAINAASVLPGMLRDFGDIPDLLAAIAPRPILAAAPRLEGDRPPPSVERTPGAFTADPAALLAWLEA